MEHIVQQGDHIARLAAKYGLHAPEIIWNDPANSDLKAKRTNFNVLFPGDVLDIPERESREESGATEKKHRFRLKTHQLSLVLRVLDFNFKPVKGSDATLWLGGEFEHLSTDGEGKVGRTLEPTAEDGRLRIQSDQLPMVLEVDLAVGHLDPLDTVEGQIARLNNMGYDAGPVAPPTTAADRERVKSAVEEFQCDHNLAVDGICGPNSQAKLKEIHGC